MKNIIRQKNNKNKAFTLIEALVAISILMIAIASPMTLAQKGLSTATQSKDQMIAAFLAQDVVEAVKNIRDQIAVSQTTGDWLIGDGNQFLKPCVCDPSNDFCSFDTQLPNQITFCQIDTTASSWSNNSIKKGFIASPVLNISYKVENGVKSFLKYDYNPQNLPNCTGVNNGECSEVSPFKRYINIIKDPTGTNPNEAVVNVRVFWNSPLGVQKIDIQDFIYNYSENL